jgi:hypothetical protein
MSLSNLLTNCETGTIFLDSYGRIWEYSQAAVNKKFQAHVLT